VCPFGVTAAEVICWGAGAGGQHYAQVTPLENGVGGGGGGCTAGTVRLTGGQTYAVTVGEGGAGGIFELGGPGIPNEDGGDTQFVGDNSTTVTGFGGHADGTGSDSEEINPGYLLFSHPGGGGGNGVTGRSNGGGGAAQNVATGGSGSPGQDGRGTVTGQPDDPGRGGAGATQTGGRGGNGGTFHLPARDGQLPGGGGGGGWANPDLGIGLGRNGGRGANGRILIRIHGFNTIAWSKLTAPGQTRHIPNGVAQVTVYTIGGGGGGSEADVGTSVGGGGGGGGFAAICLFTPQTYRGRYMTGLGRILSVSHSGGAGGLRRPHTDPGADSVYDGEESEASIVTDDRTLTISAGGGKCGKVGVGGAGGDSAYTYSAVGGAGSSGDNVFNLGGGGGGGGGGMYDEYSHSASGGFGGTPNFKTNPRPVGELIFRYPFVDDGRNGSTMLPDGELRFYLADGATFDNVAKQAMELGGGGAGGANSSDSNEFGAFKDGTPGEAGCTIVIMLSANYPTFGFATGLGRGRNPRGYTR